MRTFPEIMIFLPIGITSYFTVKYISNYIELWRTGQKIDGTIVVYGAPKGWRLQVPKMRYEISGKQYDSFVHYTQFSFLLPKRIGSTHRILVSKEDPRNCILGSVWPLLIEICLTGLMIYGGVYVMMH